MVVLPYHEPDLFKVGYATPSSTWLSPRDHETVPMLNGIAVVFRKPVVRNTNR
jgi:hypothetical protein